MIGAATAASAAGAPALLARALEASAERRRLLGPLDLAIAAGDAVAIVGPNGAGKTTLLRLLAGLRQPSAGEVRLHGAAMATLSRREVARQIVYLPQHPPVAVPLTVERYLALARYAYRDGGADEAAASTAAVERALAAVDIAELRGRPLHALSGGERQLVQLAGALVQGGHAWLVDEPTAHLDPAHQRRVAQLLAALHATAREGEPGPRTLLLATHDLNLAARLATRVVALAGGLVVADGGVREVLSAARLTELYGAPFRTLGEGDDHRVWLEL